MYGSMGGLFLLYIGKINENRRDLRGQNLTLGGKEKSGFCDEVAPMKTAPLCSQGPVKRKAGNGLYYNGL